MLLVKMAFRNLWRRKFRTLLAALALGLSYAMTIVFAGLADGGHEQMAETALRLKAGHVVIQARGYQRDRRLEQRIRHPERVDAVLAGLPRQARLVHRIFTSGLLRSADGSVRIDLLVASPPREEAAVSALRDKLVAGRFPQDGRAEVLLGHVAARKLKVRVGDSVVLTLAGLAGTRQEKVAVAGIFRTGGKTLDEGYALVPLKLGQRMLAMDDSVNQIAVLWDLEHTTRLATTLRRRLGPDLDVLTWRRAMPMLAEFLWLDSASMWVMLALVFAIVAAGITNAVLMSVMERTREIGVLRCIGMGPGRVVAEVLVESALLGLVALAIGFAAGLPLNHYLTVHGLDISALMGTDTFETAGVTFSGKMYSHLHGSTVLWTSVGVLVLSVLAAVYPGIRAARTNPVQAVGRGG